MSNTRPVYRIEANNADITATIKEHFVSLTIVDEAGVKSDSLTLVLEDSAENINLPPSGAQLRVWLGYDEGARLMGLYVVDTIGVKGPPDRITIKAKGAPMEQSKNYSALQTQQSRSWEPGTLGDLVAAIANEHGLDPAVAPSLQDHQLPHLDQINESNMHLLTRVANDVGAMAKANGGKLLVIKRGEGKTATGKEMPVISMMKVEASTYSAEIIGRSNYKQVVTVWRDVEGGKDMEATAGSGEPVRRLRHVYPNQEAAKKAASSYLEAFQRGKSTVSITCPGRPDLVAECRLNLTDFRPGIKGLWSVKLATHRVTSGGYTTTVDGEVPQ